MGTLDDLPSNAALQGIMDDLNQAMQRLPDTEQRLRSLTGVGWSADEMVKAVVGPSGQLVDLEVDPRVFRHPDTQALRASVLEAAAAAARQVAELTHEIVAGVLPPELSELRAQFDPGGDDPLADLRVTDAERFASGRRDDG